MSIIRLIHISFPPDQAAKAEQNWKEFCAPLMIRQPGCASERLLRCTTHEGEFISTSEWDSEDSIVKYLESADHQEIKRHNRNIKGASVAVKHYEVVS